MRQQVTIGYRLSEDGGIAPVLADATLCTTPTSHHGAVVAALREGPMAPLRFGTVPANGPLSLADLTEIRRLARLAVDHVEIGVRLMLSQASTATPETGQAFLRRAALRETTLAGLPALAERLRHTITALTGVKAVVATAGGADTSTLAILAERNRAADIAEAVVVAAMTETSFAGLAATTSGPWPLYSFAPTFHAQRAAA
jgi:Gas vesicle synthesis protein GvpL/GvpF